ncbi:hypothetical protein [Flavobacterium sp. ALJ2]|nr:hypothetical protein [Flavobacterium sp. ALJ2]
MRKFKKFVAHFSKVLNLKTLDNGQMRIAFVGIAKKDSNTYG